MAEYKNEHVFYEIDFIVDISLVIPNFFATRYDTTRTSGSLRNAVEVIDQAVSWFVCSIIYKPR